MSFSLQGISNTHAQIGQVKTALEMRGDTSNPISNLASGLKSKLSGPEFDTYNAQGMTNKSIGDARLITNTLDSYHKGSQWGSGQNSFTKAYSDSYNFNKEVLGSYFGALI